MGRLEHVNEPALLTVFPPHRLLEPGDLRRDGPALKPSVLIVEDTAERAFSARA